MTVNAAIYARISSDDGTALGVTRQTADCTAEAVRRGWDIAETYTDNDVSASKGAARPAYEAMLDDVRAGRINAIVVWDVDRLTRTPRELEDVITFADKHALRLASVGGEIDISTEQGRLTARLKGSVARYEVEQSSRRLKRKHAELAAAGAPNGQAPYGYDRRRVDGVAVNVINPAEAAVLRETFGRVLAGGTLWGICQDLNARSIKTKNGHPWQTQVLRRMLLNPRYAGLRTVRNEIVGKAAWDPIIERETFDRLTATLTDPARRKSHSTRLKYLLSGLALCGKCGRPVVGTAEFKYTYRTYPHSYACNHAGCHGVSRQMAPVDEFVEAVIVGVLERDGVRLLGGDPDTAREARAEVETLEARLALAADQFADGAITAEQLARITAKLRVGLDAARRRLAVAQPDQSLAEFAGDNVAEAWTAAALHIKRQVIRMLATITLLPLGPGNPTSPESIQIEWKGQK